MVRGVTLAIAAALAACGRVDFAAVPADAEPAVVPAPPEYVSGARLRARIEDVEGSTQLAAWFDTQLGEECTLAVAEDGMTRCLPSRFAVGVQFTDASCTTPLIEGIVPADPTGCTSANQLARYDRGTTVRVVQVGALYTGTVYQASGGCVPLGSSVFPYYLVGATVPPDQFVAFHDELTPTGELAYIEHVGDDGARQLDDNGMIVRASDARCKLVELSSNRMGCVPDRPYTSLVYADAACTERATATSDQVAPEMLAQDYDTCGEQYFHVTLGAELSTYYELTTQGCIANATSASLRAFRIAAMEPETIYAAGTLTPNAMPAAASVVGAYWAFDAGQTLPAGYFDRRHGDQCAVTSLGTAGGRVCAPLWTGSVPLFSDASCSTSLSAYPSCRGSWRATWFPAQQLQFTCEGIAEDVKLFDTSSPPPLYSTHEASCVEVDALTSAATMSFVSLPASAMIPATRRTD